MSVDDPQPRAKDGDAAVMNFAERTVTVPDLKPFADQLMAIARHLRDGNFPVKGSVKPALVESGPENATADHRAQYATVARRLYLLRQERAAIFGNPDLFGEPAWDILLDLYVAHVDEKQVSVSSACIGSGTPSTTGLRWLGILAENDLVEREQDPEDQRRVLVKLTERGLEAMDVFLARSLAK